MKKILAVITIAMIVSCSIESPDSLQEDHRVTYVEACKGPGIISYYGLDLNNNGVLDESEIELVTSSCEDWTEESCCDENEITIE